MSKPFPLHRIGGFPPIPDKSESIVFGIERYGSGFIVVVFDRNTSEEHPVYKVGG